MHYRFPVFGESTRLYWRLAFKDGFIGFLGLILLALLSLPLRAQAPEGLSLSFSGICFKLIPIDENFQTAWRMADSLSPGKEQKTARPNFSGAGCELT
jgi:hypothetical protein